MANIHFFTEPTNVVQVPTKKFGPESNSKYRITTQFQAQNSDTKVFAPFACNIIIVDSLDAALNVDDTLVNLILQPISANTTELTPGIEYIIIRGVKRDGFMYQLNAGAQWELLTLMMIGNGTELMNYIYQNVNAPDLTGFKYEPYTTSNDGQTLFEKVMLSTGGCFKANAGMEIGRFDAILGVDFVLRDWTKFNATHQYAALEDYVIDVGLLTNYTTGVPAGQEHAEVLAAREEILSFIDPAAYYNMHRETGVGFTNGNTVTNVTKDNDELHTNIISKFSNANRIYVDIRNDNDYSLNFYQDNQDAIFNNIEVNFNGSGSQLLTYYNNNWPILIKDNLLPPSGKNFNTLDISFFTTYNPAPRIYYDYAFSYNIEIINTNKIRFITNKGQEKFYDPDNLGTQTTYNTLFTYGLENSSNASCCYSKIYYLRTKKPTINLPARAVVGESPLDNLFGFITHDSICGVKTNLLDTVIGGNGTFTFVGISKKYLPEGKWSTQDRFIQTGFGYSNSDVVFYAFDIDRTGEFSNEFNYGNHPSVKVKQVQTGFRKVSSNAIEIKNTYGFELKNLTTPQDAIPYIEQSYDLSKYKDNDRDFIFFLKMTKEEFDYIRLYPSNSGAFPENLDMLNPQYHSIGFGFDLNSKEQSSDGLYYGKARIVLQGISDNGQFETIPQISYPGNTTTYPGQNLFVVSYDAKSFATSRYAQQAGSYDVVQRNPNRAVYSVSEFIDMLKEIERVFDEPVATTVTRLRQHYYGYYDYQTRPGEKDQGWFPKANIQQFALEMAIPMAPISNGLLGNVGMPYPLIDPDVYFKLIARADENGVADNPSPYLKEPDSPLKKIDIGHLLYGLDSLINNYENTFWGYAENYGIKISNILTGSIADVFTPAAEARIYRNEQNYKIEEFYYPDNLDYNRLYEISAPFADLYSDVDAFGIYNAWKFFTSGSNFIVYKQNNSIPANAQLTFSFLLNYYYDSGYDPDNLPLKYPID